MVVSPAKPRVYFLSVGATPAWLKAAFSTTGRVTPCRVRSPVTSAVRSPVSFTPVALNAAFGYLATSRKSAPFRWLSSLSFRVPTLPVSMLTSRVAASGLAGSIVRLAATPVNWPT